MPGSAPAARRTCPIPAPAQVRVVGMGIGSPSTTPSCETYLGYTRAVALKGRTLTVALPNPQTLEWLELRLRPLILSVLHATAGRELEVEFCLT